jgi:aspartyl/asparaginyl-tRNA synthetase
MEKSRKLKPAKQRWIKELSDADIDTPVRILGSVVDIKPMQDNQTYAVLDDGTNRFQVIFNQPTPLKLGAQIRVFGTIKKTSQNELVMEADFLQDMKDLDMGLYKRVQEIKRRFDDSFEKA